MGLVFEETTSRKLRSENTVAHFCLYAYSDDFHEENEEGAFCCDIKIKNKNGDLLEEYRRLFLVAKFHEKHYERFVNKFCNDVRYRDQFNVKHFSEDKSQDGAIDERIADLVKRFNDLGFETKYSCQGTDEPWQDRPCHSDGHSVTAYVTFYKWLPDCMMKLLQSDSRLNVRRDAIYASHRRYNVNFVDCVNFLLDRWIACNS